MTKDEALQLALEALEVEQTVYLRTKLPVPEYLIKAITAIKEALETKDAEVEEANHIIFKSCINQPHWKRSAMRYLKRNAPMLHHQAVTEFNEHPDGRGQE